MAIRILIVDDEPLILKGLRFSLEQDGYLVQEALDGETALALAQSNQYDIILLDVMLPKMSGMDVLRGIRERSQVPVIMLTAKGDDMDKIPVSYTHLTASMLSFIPSSKSPCSKGFCRGRYIG